MKEKRVYLIGGSGGVGKTTLSAALAMGLAEKGHRTVILTVDPARRLAQAMGLDGLDSDLKEVALSQKSSGKLFVSMLDSRRYFDKLIARFAKSQAQRDRILGNPLYQIMVEHLGGSHEYAAMERLLEFSQDKSFDKVIIDTPPTQNAMELFDAPRRLAEFMDGSVLRWFQGGQKLYLQLFRTGTRVAMKLLHHVFGSDFIQSLEGFFEDFEGMQTGFRERHLEVLETLKAPSTSFWLVTDASETRWRESQVFYESLKSRDIRLDRVLINRLEYGASSVASLGKPPADPKIMPLLRYLEAIANEQRQWVQAFEKTFTPIPVIKIERQSKPPHDTTALSKLGSLLVS